MRGWSCSRSWSPAAARSVPSLHFLPSPSYLYSFISLPFHFEPPIPAQRWKPKPCRVVSCKFRFPYAPSTLFLLLSVVFLLLLREATSKWSSPLLLGALRRTCARALRSKTPDRPLVGARHSPSSCLSPCKSLAVVSFNAMSSKTWRCRIILAPCGRHVHMGVLHAGLGVGRGREWLGFRVDDKGERHLDPAYLTGALAVVVWAECGSKL